MAILYITEYAGVARTQIGGNYSALPACPPVAEQTVAIGGSTASSAAFNAATTMIRVSTDAICSVRVGGTAPAATAVTGRMPANTTEYFGVTPGDKIAVISNT